MRQKKPKKPPLSPEQKHKARFARIFRVYGITEEQYKEIDHGFCFVCERVWSDTVRPCVDHDHVSKRVRGLLCTYCNRYRVGRFRDVALVQRIVDYLSAALQIPEWIVPEKKKKKRNRNRNKKFG